MVTENIKISTDSTFTVGTKGYPLKNVHIIWIKNKSTLLKIRNNINSSIFATAAGKKFMQKPVIV